MLEGIYFNQKIETGDFLVVHWLRICLQASRGSSCSPGRELKIPHTQWDNYAHTLQLEKTRALVKMQAAPPPKKKKKKIKDRNMKEGKKISDITLGLMKANFEKSLMQ